MFSDTAREKGRLDQSPCKFSRYGLERYLTYCWNKEKNIFLVSIFANLD